MKRLISLFALAALPVAMTVAVTWAATEADHAIVNGSIILNQTNVDLPESVSSGSVEVKVTGQMDDWSKYEGTLGNVELGNNIDGYREILIRNTENYQIATTNTKIYTLYLEPTVGVELDPSVMIKVTQDDAYNGPNVSLYDGRLVDLNKENGADIFVGYENDELDRGYSRIVIEYYLVNEPEQTSNFSYQLRLEEAQVYDPVVVVNNPADGCYYIDLKSGSYQTFMVPGDGQGFSTGVNYAKIDQITLWFLEGKEPDNVKLEIKDVNNKVVAQSPLKKSRCIEKTCWYYANEFSESDLVPLGTGEAYKMFILSSDGSDIHGVEVAKVGTYGYGDLYMPDGNRESSGGILWDISMVMVVTPVVY